MRIFSEMTTVRKARALPQEELLMTHDAGHVFVARRSQSLCSRPTSLSDSFAKSLDRELVSKMGKRLEKTVDDRYAECSALHRAWRNVVSSEVSKLFSDMRCRVCEEVRMSKSDRTRSGMPTGGSYPVYTLDRLESNAFIHCPGILCRRRHLTASFSSRCGWLGHDNVLVSSRQSLDSPVVSSERSGDHSV